MNFKNKHDSYHGSQLSNQERYNSFVYDMSQLLSKYELRQQEAEEFLTYFLATYAAHNENELLCFSKIVHMLSRWMIGLASE